MFFLFLFKPWHRIKLEFRLDWERWDGYVTFQFVPLESSNQIIKSYQGRTDRLNQVVLLQYFALWPDSARYARFLKKEGIVL